MGVNSDFTPPPSPPPSPYKGGGESRCIMNNQIAQISEIFSSLQGEGTHMGERHLFLRFEACNIHCEYCDELGKPGFDFDLDSVLQKLIETDHEFGPHSYISLTGGEPLLYLSFLKPLLPKLKNHGFRIYLETNGILWKALDQIISMVDIIAMDVKPASVTKERSFLEEHEKFLKRSLRNRKETFIKIICSKEIDLDEFRELCTMIQAVILSEAKDLHLSFPHALGGNPKSGFPTRLPARQVKIFGDDNISIPVILQPISADIEGHDDPELMRLLNELQTLALGVLSDVRIVPRLHKILKIK